jgi:hydroxyethylthiazole kinase-like uncharacterized protein yjeF
MNERLNERLGLKHIENLKDIKLVSRERARELDLIAEKEYSIPTLLLMENAGRMISENALKIIAEKEFENVVIIAGKGNNGGDGFCAAKHIKNQRKKTDIKIIILEDEKKIKGDALVNFQIVKKMGIPVVQIRESDELKNILPKEGIVIDAIFGTGLSKDIEDKFILNIIDEINLWKEADEEKKDKDKKRFVVAVDIPSGLDSNQGVPRPKAVKADMTITFAPAKVGLFTGDSAKFTGKIIIEDIGIPVELWENSEFTLIAKEIVRGILKGRDDLSHKGTYGHLLCIVGGLGRAGAAVLSGKGALHIGTGLVTIITPDVVYNPVASGAREFMVIPAPSQNKTFSEKACEVIDEHIEGKTAILIGPGIWDEEGSQKVLIHTINRAKEKKIPVVIDADAINILSHLDLGILDGVSGVITPHPGEAARLLKKTTSEIQKDRIQSAKEISQKTKLVSVLKGFRTVITDGENFFINTTGGAELATGGTGDVLAGIIGGLLAQGYSLMESAVAGVFIHGLAGEIVSKEKKFKLSLAEEVAENLERALAEIFSV